MAKRIHILSNIDPEAMTATCQHCGVVPVVLRSAPLPGGVRGKRWTCSVVNKLRWQAAATNPKYGPARDKAQKVSYAKRKAAKQLEVTEFGTGVDAFEAKTEEPTPVPPVEDLEELLKSFGDSFGEPLG